MPRLALSLTLVFLSLSLDTPALSQHLVSEQKTIEISATEKVVVPADTATVKIGYQNRALTKDAVYAENTREANKILQALLDAGVPKEAIETESLRLEQEQKRYGAKPDQPLKYSGSQKWQIHLKASDAQKIVDIAVAAGANQIENVEWIVSDPDQLEAKAYAAAIKRAKNLAEQTATQTGLKLGEVVSISNSPNSAREFMSGSAGGFAMISAPKVAMLKLQPGTVEREASVTITYAVVP
jgi:uncharacterized protein YggE